MAKILVFKYQIFKCQIINSKNIFKILSICSVILFLLPSAIAEDITFSELGMTSEFNSGRSGTTPIGTFYSTSNDYPLEIIVNAHWRTYYRLIVYLNDEPIDSGKIIGNVNFSATFKKESIKIGKNSIYIYGNPWGAWPFGVQFGNLIIYGNSKISSPDIFLPPPSLTPISTPTPTYNWDRGTSSGASPNPTPIQTPSLTPSQTPTSTPNPTPTPSTPPPNEPNARSPKYLVYIVGLLIFVIAVGIIQEKTKKRAKFEQDQHAKGFIKFIDRFGSDKWGIPQEVEKWKREDSEVKYKESLFSMVIESIKRFEPSTKWSYEEGYHGELISYLKQNYPNAKAEHQTGASRPDIVIDDIAIEVKGPTDRQALDTLTTKCLKYSHHYVHFIIVLFEPKFSEFSETHYNEILGGITKHFPNVVVIRKNGNSKQNQRRF